MIDSRTIIKYLWKKHCGNISAILADLRRDPSGGYIRTSDAIAEAAAFDERYCSITIAQDGFKDILYIIESTLNFPTELGPTPVLFRWNRTGSDDEDNEVVKRLLADRQKTTFVLADDIRQYHAPGSLSVIGYYTSADGYHIVDGTGRELLCTEYETEVLWFALITCKYLLIGGKTPVSSVAALTINDELKQKLVNIYVKSGPTPKVPQILVMALPGAAGCFSNRCLKGQRNPGQLVTIAFVDSWKDVATITDIDE